MLHVVKDCQTNMSRIWFDIFPYNIYHGASRRNLTSWYLSICISILNFLSVGLKIVV